MDRLHVQPLLRVHAQEVTSLFLAHRLLQPLHHIPVLNLQKVHHENEVVETYIVVLLPDLRPADHVPVPVNGVQLLDVQLNLIVLPDQEEPRLRVPPLEVQDIPLEENLPVPVGHHHAVVILDLEQPQLALDLHQELLLENNAQKSPERTEVRLHLAAALH